MPVTSAAMKNSGTPIGTVIAMPCEIEPVSTARRTLALLNANEAAEQSARKASEHLTSLPVTASAS